MPSWTSSNQSATGQTDSPASQSISPTIRLGAETWHLQRLEEEKASSSSQWILRPKAPTLGSGRAHSVTLPAKKTQAPPERHASPHLHDAQRRVGPGSLQQPSTPTYSSDHVAACTCHLELGRVGFIFFTEFTTQMHVIPCRSIPLRAACTDFLGARVSACRRDEPPFRNRMMVLLNQTPRKRRCFR